MAPTHVLLWSVVAATLAWAVTGWLRRHTVPSPVVTSGLHPVIAVAWTAAWCLQLPAQPWAHLVAATAAVVGSCLGAAVTVDIAEHRLPNVFTYSAAAVSLLGLLGVGIWAGDLAPALRALVGGGGLALAFLALALIAPGGMGLGDVKLAVTLGASLAWLGWSALVVGVTAAFVTGGLFALVLVLARRAHRSTRIAFGPWLVLGALIGLIIPS